LTQAALECRPGLSCEYIHSRYNVSWFSCNADGVARTLSVLRRSKQAGRGRTKEGLAAAGGWREQGDVVVVCSQGKG
jgi:hypothetical protein